MRRARIVRIEWEDSEPIHDDYLCGKLDNGDIQYALEKVFREYKFTVNGEPSFTVEESGE
jgi:hypothetical protein